MPRSRPRHTLKSASAAHPHVQSKRNNITKPPTPTPTLKIEHEPIPSAFLCPITTEMMHTPVIDLDGNTYEYAAIKEWLVYNNTSPITRTYMCETDLVPNRALQELLGEFKRAHPEHATATAAATATATRDPTLMPLSTLVAGYAYAACMRRLRSMYNRVSAPLLHNHRIRKLANVVHGVRYAHASMLADNLLALDADADADARRRFVDGCGALSDNLELMIICDVLFGAGPLQFAAFKRAYMRLCRASGLHVSRARLMFAHARQQAEHESVRRHTILRAWMMGTCTIINIVILCMRYL